MSIDLTTIKNARTNTGYITPIAQKRIEALLRENSLDNWSKSFSIIIDGYNSLWFYVCVIDRNYPRKGKAGSIRAVIPSRAVIIDAIELAIETSNLPIIEQARLINKFNTELIEEDK
jgi:hypothetical protein